VGTGTFDRAASAVPQTTYYNYRESEVKHGRFAMTAFLAIFFEEADRSAVARQLGFPDAIDNLDATLGLDEVQLPALLLGIGAQALAEYDLQRQEGDDNVLSNLPPPLSKKNLGTGGLGSHFGSLGGGCGLGLRGQGQVQRLHLSATLSQRCQQKSVRYAPSPHISLSSQWGGQREQTQLIRRPILRKQGPRTFCFSQQL